MCTMGFSTTVSGCTAGNCATKEENNTSTIRIIPGMLFTCSGTVTHWRAAGEFLRINASINPVLSIWRRRSSREPETYDRVGGIELGRCGSGIQAPLVMGLRRVYECTLPQNERVSVQPRDTVGIELSEGNNARFRLYFDGDDGSQNYVFNRQTLQTFNFNRLNAGRNESAQPQILLTVEIATEVPPTTQPLVTTSSTTEMTVHTGSLLTQPLATTSPSTEKIASTEDPSIAIVGGIVTLAVLLTFIIVLLLILILRSQRSGQKLSPVPASDRENIVNPTYSGKQSSVVLTVW